MLSLLLASWLAFVPVALAENARQLEHSADEGVEETVVTMAWKTADGRDRISFSLSTAEVMADKSVKRKVQLEALYVAMAKAARRSALGHKKVELTARVSPGGVQLGAKGPPKAAKAAMADAQDAMAQAKVDWLAENRVFEAASGGLSYDHARIVAERASAVAPVGAALREGTSTDREFIERALRFTQSIPYQVGKKGRDTGFQRPLALVVRNKGDCDGKAVLFLAIVHAELPDLPLAMIYVPGHALVGVGLPAQGGDKAFDSAGQTYIYAEPVGPGVAPLGQTAPENKRAGKTGKVRPVPR